MAAKSAKGTTLVSKFIVTAIIPIATLLIIFYAVVYYYESGKSVENEITNTRLELERIAALVAYPIWNFDLEQTSRVLKNSLENPRIKGLRIDYLIEPGADLPRAFGADKPEPGEQVMKTPLALTLPDNTKQQIGTLEAIVTTEGHYQKLKLALARNIAFSLFLILILSLGITYALRLTVLSPLSAVIESLEQFKQTNRRKPVAWQSNDELAEFIGEYNKSLAHAEELEDGLRQARETAEASNQAKSMFLSNMSHEIRTPMNAVLGFAQMLERDPSLSPSARNKVATIMKSGEHLLSIINDILEMSRIEAGRVEIRRQPIDLHALLNDMAAMFRLRCEQKGLAFTLDVSREAPHFIIADLGKVRQVMINLLGNAVKFTRTGSIVLRAFPVGSDRLAIEVQDSGIGITAEEQEKLFRPFERTRSGEQEAGGTGLGLAISREYAHLMGGEISLTSQTGEGSFFRFEFSAPATALAPESMATHRRVTGLAPGQGEIRILVVDDESSNRELLRQMLEPLGFVVHEAMDGKDAIAKAQESKPRIILMDMVMAGMDGIAATRILRSSYPDDSLAIIGISASAFEAEKKMFLEAGVNAFISKPFREQELFDVLASHAAVLFVTGKIEELPATQQHAEAPNVEKMSPEWREAFREALFRKNITRIRKLGEEARTVDSLLASWLLERVNLYDLDGLKQVKDCNENQNGASDG